MDAHQEPASHVRVVAKARGRRRVRIALAAVVALIGVWSGSFVVDFHFQTPAGYYGGLITNGGVQLCYDAFGCLDSVISFERNETPAVERGWFWSNHWPLAFFCFPLWPLFVPIGAFLVMALRYNAQIRGAKLCGSCGYDLAGTAGRPCPECGQAHERSSARSSFK